MPQADTTTLDDLANYSADWTHRDKEIHPGDELVLPGAYLKWYDIRRADQPATPEVTEQAREYLRAEAAAGRLELRNEMGFVLLHRDGEKFFMLVCVWRDKNEMWQGLFRRGRDGFEVYPTRQGLLRPTQCVLELDATSHERRAWSRYLRSSRDAAAKRAYLDDLCTGQLV
jgi:hypothetical protein